MALPVRQVIDIPLGGGLAEHIDQALVDPPAAATLENAQIDKIGRLTKRNGFSIAFPSLATQPDTEVPAQVVAQTFEQESALYSLTKWGGLYRYGSFITGGSARVANRRARPVPVEVRDNPLLRVVGDVFDCDTWTNPARTLTCTAALANGNLYVTVTEALTGRLVFGPFAPTLVGIVPTRVRVSHALLPSTAFLIFIAHAGSISVFTLAYTTVITGGLAGPFAISAGTGVPGENYAAGTPITTTEDATLTGNVHIAWPEVLGPNDAWIKRVNSTGAVTQSAAIVGAGGASASATLDIAHGPVDFKIWVATANTGGTSLRHARLNSDYTVFSALAVVDPLVGFAVVNASIVPATSGGASVAWSETADASDAQHVRWRGLGTIATAATARAYHCELAARGFRRDGRNYFPCRYYPGIVTRQPQGLLLSPDDFDLAGSAAPTLRVAARYLQDREQRSATTPASRLPSSSIADTVHGATFRTAALSLGGDGTTRGVDLVDFDLYGTPQRVIEHERNVYIAAGSLWCFDGQNTQETIPDWFPEAPTIASSLSGVGPEAGVHSWVVVHEWEDANGVLHRSAPSPAVTFTVVALNRLMTLTYRTLAISGATPRVAVFRTKLLGTVFFLVGRAVPTPAATNGLATFVDQIADAALGEILYTTGGILPNAAPPPPLDIAIHRERMHLIDSTRPADIWYSKILRPTVAPEFAGELLTTIPRGAATALASLDDKLIIFSQDEVWVVTGDGPTDAGQQDSFSRPQLVSSDAGCTERQSVVTGPFGVIFRSRRGFELLTRGLQVEYLGAGAAVEDTLGTGRVVSALLLERHHEVRFTIAGRTTPIVWDYMHNAWLTHTLASLAPATDLVQTRVGNQHIIVEAAGGVLSENVPSRFDASSTHIRLRYVSPWIKLGSLQGFQRVRRAIVYGQAFAACRVRVKVYYDYDPVTVAQTEAFDVATAENPLTRGIHLVRQKCQAVRFEIYDDGPTGAEGSSSSQGADFVRVSLEVAILGGLKRLPASQTG